MAPLPCSCEKGVSTCPTALRLWQAYMAARDIERVLFDGMTDPNGDADTDPVMYDRYRLAGQVRRDALRKYERHVDGEDVSSLPVPDRLIHDVINGP
jgi:pyruvate dehydrogenase complex dehydrogenase (E1) component